jgi:peptide/nickel transport system permease protein
MTEEDVTKKTQAEPAASREAVEEPLSEAAELSQWQLMVRRFKQNKLAMGGIVLLVIMYLMVAFAGFLAPSDPFDQNDDYVYGPPSKITFINPAGRFGLKPYTYAIKTELNEETFKFEFTQGEKIPIKFFIRGGESYKLLGLIESNVHLFGVEPPNRFYLLGADVLGRDMWSRILEGGKISMTVGLVGIALSIIFGSTFGAASGYWGGWIDDVMQRIIEVIQSFPQVPLWAALAAALPNVSESFTMVHRYFLITVILSLVGWTGLARQIRGKVMAYRKADFTQAALAAGASDRWIIFQHMLPNALSHIIVVAALAVPGMILGETGLSFLGLGISRPLVSWGVLIADAQQVAIIVEHPWLLIPALAVVITVLAFSVLGDGLRDAFDPYSI